MSQNKKKYTVHVLCGTHWDREWRYTAEQSKLRLSLLMDNLLDILEKEPRYKCFHIDGGAVVLDDYLDARPENRERLEKHIRDGRISLVNWFTLPDTYTVAPEALIRNLLVGKRKADVFGGSMRAGYTATSYGQTSQLPQIYRGFGIESALFYRGTNKHKTPPICHWQGRDGSRLYLIRCFDEVTRTNWFFYVHQPVVLGKGARDLSYTYSKKDLPVRMADEIMYMSDFQVTHEENAFDDTPETLKKGEALLREQAYKQAIGRHVLALDMEDNAKPYPLLPDMLEKMNALSEDSEYVQNTLDEYVDTVIAEVKEDPNLFVHEGELRYTAIEPGFNGLLGSTHASRMILKLKNEEAETELIMVAEPLASWASMLGWSYPRTLLDRAWVNLLLNHAHDNICGAAIDQAHEDMLPRFAAALTLGREIGRRACEELWKGIDLSGFGKDDQTLTIFNTLPTPRKGVALVVVDLPRDMRKETAVDASAGVGEDTGEQEVWTGYEFFDLVDEKGHPVEHAILSREGIRNRVERELDTAVGFPVDRVRMLMNMEVAGLGYRTYAIRPRGPRYEKDLPTGGERHLIAQPNGRMANQHLEIQILSNGSFDLTNRATGKRFHGLHLFQDNGSVGNAHISHWPTRDFEITSLGCQPRIVCEEATQLRGIYRIDLILQVPSEATRDGKERLRDWVDIPITTRLILSKDSPRLDIRTRVLNTARDHRLRILFPTDIRTDHVDVESAFTVERRCFLWTRTGDNTEGHYPFQPMQNFIDLSDGHEGLAFLSKGIREYEVMDDDRRTMALTLFRTHRAYMTSTDDMTREELDKQRGMQALGELEYQYALFPHCGDWRQGHVLQEAYDHKVPIRILQGVSKPGQLPCTASLFTVDPNDKISLSACCQSEDGKAYMLRLWNNTDEDIKGKLNTLLPIGSITKVRMDETERFETLSHQGPTWTLPLRKGEIATLRLEVNR